MAMIRWEPVGEVQTIQNEMNRLVNTLFDAPGQATRPNSMRRWIPSIDLVETAENYVLRADLPGVAEGDVKIEIEGKLLTISGERNPEHEEDGEGYYRLERPCGAFSRSLTFSDELAPDSVRAQFDRGVLEIQIPKPAPRKPARVAISGGEAAAQSESIKGVQTAAASSAGAREPVAAGV